MPGRLSIDFGTSNTVVATWDPSLQEATCLHLEGLGKLLPSEPSPVSLVPSLIHYPEKGSPWVGQEVVSHNLAASKRTFRGMKRYIGVRSPVKRTLNGREISHRDAGHDFLAAVLGRACRDLELQDEEIAVTVPVEAFEDYDHWLAGVIEGAGFSRLRLLDEASAAALGYRAEVRPGDACLVFDFGGGTLDVAVLMLEDGPAGPRCRVLGKSGADLGGTTVDQWLFAEVLRREGRQDSDEDVRPVSRALLHECERVKETLSSRDRADLSVIHPETGAVLGAEFTRAQFEAILDEHEAYATLTQTVQRSLMAAQERGYGPDDVRAVLMVGGSSLIPSVQRTVQHIFGRERVRLDRPMDAVARGAAAFVAGMDFVDHIQHDYAIRYVSPSAGGYDYRVIVKRGTPYPTREPVAQLTVKATATGQTQLGIAIYEVADRPRARGQVELVFDTSGAARLATVSDEQTEGRTHFWMNQGQPTFLRADPPAQQGERRFRVSFSVDGNRHLTMSATDLTTDRVVYEDYPVVKLT